NQKGLIAETAIVHAALKVGIGVARPMNDERYDLIFDVGSDLVRVQCKWAVIRSGALIVRCVSRRRAADGFVTRSYGRDEIDAIAAYCAEIDRCFYVPLDVLRRERGISLRVIPPRNHQ